MTPTDLPLAVSRHATSKLKSNDLFNISTFGFRGEALPSLGAVSRLNIKTKGDLFYVSYNSPYKVFNRRNEVMVEVEYED